MAFIIDTTGQKDLLSNQESNIAGDNESDDDGETYAFLSEIANCA